MLQSCATRFENLRRCVPNPLGREFCNAMCLSVILPLALLVQAVEGRISPFHPVVSSPLGCHLHLVHCKQSHSRILKADIDIVTLENGTLHQKTGSNLPEDQTKTIMSRVESTPTCNKQTNLCTLPRPCFPNPYHASLILISQLLTPLRALHYTTSILTYSRYSEVKN